MHSAEISCVEQSNLSSWICIKPRKGLEHISARPFQSPKSDSLESNSFSKEMPGCLSPVTPHRHPPSHTGYIHSIYVQQVCLFKVTYRTLTANIFVRFLGIDPKTLPLLLLSSQNLQNSWSCGYQLTCFFACVFSLFCTALNKFEWFKPAIEIHMKLLSYKQV